MVVGRERVLRLFLPDEEVDVIDRRLIFGKRVLGLLIEIEVCGRNHLSGPILILAVREYVSECIIFKQALRRIRQGLKGFFAFWIIKVDRAIVHCFAYVER